MSEVLTALPPIKLRCGRCDNVSSYERDVDPTIPACVVVIECTPCPECDNGDFGSETWFDADGNEVSPNIETICRPPEPCQFPHCDCPRPSAGTS